MQSRKLGTLSVSKIGLGCMGMSHAYGGQDELDAIKTIHRAVEFGVNFFDTAEVYGPFENEILVGRALKPFRDDVVIATKFGFRIAGAGAGTGHQRMGGIDGRPEHVQAVAEASLKRMGVEVIDLFYQHRVDPEVPIEETVGAMADLVHAGKVRALGLSEPGAATLRRAHAVHPISAVQSEYSLWSRDPENEILPICRELNIGFVPYAPLGRGLLTGKLNSLDALVENDFRRGLPRFNAQNFEPNVRAAAELQRLEKALGATAAQLALAWLSHRSEFIVPIPGARKLAHLEENIRSAEIKLSDTDLASIEAAMPASGVSGNRFPEAALKQVNL